MEMWQAKEQQDQVLPRSDIDEVRNTLQTLTEELRWAGRRKISQLKHFKQIYQPNRSEKYQKDDKTVSPHFGLSC